MGADEQGGGESAEAIRQSGFSRSGQAEAEAILAALSLVAGYPAEVFNHIITFGDEQGQVYLLRQGFHAFQTALVL